MVCVACPLPATGDRRKLVVGRSAPLDRRPRIIHREMVTPFRLNRHPRDADSNHDRRQRNAVVKGVTMFAPPAQCSKIGKGQAPKGDVISSSETLRARETNDAGMLEPTSLLASIVDASDDAIVAKTLDGVVATWNAAAEAIYGYSAAEMIGRPISVLMPPGRQDEMTTILAKIRAGDRIEHHQTTRVRKDGQPIEVSLTVSPIYDAGGQLSGACSIAREVTARKRAEERIAASAASARSFIEASLDPLVTINPEGKIIDVNEATVRITGRPRAELLGTEFSDHFTDPASARRGYEEVFARGSVIDYPLTICDRRGRLTDVLYNASLYRDQEGTVLGVVATARDVTERKRTKEALRLTQLSVDRSADLVHWVSPQGEILYANDSACVRHGYTRDEMLGMRLCDLDPELSPDAWRRRWREIKKRGSCVLETTHRTKSGELFPVEVTSNYITQAGREYEFAFMRDISERRQAEEAREQGHDLLAKLAERVPGMIYQFELHPDGRTCIPWTSPAINDIFEVTPQDVREDATPVFERLHPDDHDRVSSLIEESARTLQSFHIEYRVVLPRQGVRWHLSDALPERSEEGGTLWHGVIVDITERKLVGEALKTSQTQLQAAMDLADLVSWEFDVETGLFTFNDRFYALYGTTAEREGGYQMLAGVYAERFVYPDERHLVAEEVRKGIESTDPSYHADLEHRIVRRDGEIRNIVVRYGVTKDQYGRTIKTHGANQDITERKRAEAALHASEERFRAIFEQGSVGIAVLDTEQRFLRVNPSFASFLGYEEGELTQCRMEEVTAAGDIEPSQWESQGLLAGECTALEMDKQYRRKDGELVWGHVSATVLRGTDGLPVGTVAMVQDISERKRAESLLHLTQFSIDHAADAVMWTDPDAHLLFVSDSLCASLGYTREELLRMTLFDIDPVLSGRQWSENWTKMKNQGPFVVETVHRRRDGREFPVEVSVNYVVFENQEYNCAIVRDITERKQNEDALAQAEAQLRQAQKMEAVGQLAGGIAHDFNNLLTAVIGNSDLVLQSMAPEDPNRELVADIREVGERAAGLTRQILAFSRQQMLKPEVLCLNDVVTGLEPLLGRTLGEDVRMHILLAADLDHVEVDPNQMGQVLMNLAVNARDAMPDGGELVIETANVDLDRAYCRVHSELKSGPHALLAVSDSGCGMDEETKSRIFEPFFTTKEVGKGTGLGLSTVFGIVKQSGGSISVYSELGKGSSFKVYLPVCRPPDAPQVEQPCVGEGTQGTETILVVEDEAPLRHLLVRILSRSGYQVLEAASAAEIDGVLGRDKPVLDLLITDMVLPGGKSGREVAADLRDHQPGLPVIFMSGYTRDSAVFNGSLGEDADFLEKPFTPGGLLEKVRTALDKGMAMRALFDTAAASPA